ncbi:MAG: alpha,alpha-trehalase TreF [Gammaproteobacteria bacterium]|nr:alpha,alpha-trehalase TreF [Gammaproteobacteria bacterium]
MPRKRYCGQRQLPAIPAGETLTPDDRYQELFVEVQMQRVYPDGKIFVDCSPKHDPDQILADYRSHRHRPGFDLTKFVHDNFEPQHPDPRDYVSPGGRSLPDHIDALWDVLSRQPDDHPYSSSLLPLPRPYVVPGGRFCEIYYWDTYFTMLGLAASGRRDLMQTMADNFAYLIQTYGHVPNGNRTYYLGRSQPPLFAYIVELFEEQDICRALDYLPCLLREHAYWMAGVQHLQPGEQRAHAVRLDDGSVLNRYWDERDTPREQSYREDVLTARGSNRPRHEVFRDTRAGAACGWDFSSRWFGDPQDMATIRTTKILPVDLNCFLYKLECVIADLSVHAHHPDNAKTFRARADARREAIDKFFWNHERGVYLDYDWQIKALRQGLNAATIIPLFCKLASAQQAKSVAAAVRAQLLDPGGLATTLVANGQQWDQPNGWAPLQWIAIVGLKNYGEHALADDIADRWLDTVAAVYRRHSKLVEKYDLRSAQPGGGGEYALQDGFGWTNGVTRCLLQMYPHHLANQARAETDNPSA